jgi:hypothetical protein
MVKRAQVLVMVGMCDHTREKISSRCGDDQQRNAI